MRNVLIVFAGLMVILVAIAITLWRLDSAKRRERRDAGTTPEPGPRAAR